MQSCSTWHMCQVYPYGCAPPPQHQPAQARPTRSCCARRRAASLRTWCPRRAWCWSSTSAPRWGRVAGCQGLVCGGVPIRMAVQEPSVFGLRDEGGGWPLFHLQPIPLGCPRPSTQFPLDRGGASREELDSLEYQVGAALGVALGGSAKREAKKDMPWAWIEGASWVLGWLCSLAAGKEELHCES